MVADSNVDKHFFAQICPLFSKSKVGNPTYNQNIYQWLWLFTVKNMSFRGKLALCIKRFPVPAVKVQFCDLLDSLRQMAVRLKPRKQRKRCSSAAHIELHGLVILSSEVCRRGAQSLAVKPCVSFPRLLCSVYSVSLWVLSGQWLTSWIYRRTALGLGWRKTRSQMPYNELDRWVLANAAWMEQG